jgi:capsular polysaccharide biosynthesis protein
VRFVVLLVIAAIVAGVVYVVSDGISPKYSASSTMIVSVNGGSGLTDVSVTASNDLASQYAQLANSAPVVRSAEKRLKAPPGSLDGKISGSTVSAQNIIKVSAEAEVPEEAQRRADAATDALIGYVTSINAKSATRYASAVNFRLKPIDKQIADVEKRLDKGSEASRRNASLVLANLVSQRQQVQSTIAQNAAGSQPNLQAVTPATSGSKTSPKPGLYALVALLIVLLIGGRIAVAPLLSKR